MRKGSWLNRPVIIKQANETNKYDVAVAKAKALPGALNAVKQYANDGVLYYGEIRRIINSSTEK